MKETILIVDDEIGIREMLQRFLEKKDFEVMAASNGNHALDKLNHRLPDVVLLDIEMPGMDGFEVCQLIRKKYDIPIIFLSVRRDVMDKVKCLELGGDDYITKPFDHHELEARIRAVLRRYKLDDASERKMLVFGELIIDLKKCECHLNGNQINLSTKEMQLLQLLAKHPERIWSAEQLYDHIWGFDSIGDIQTVKVHISNLRKKLELDSSNQTFIKTIRGFGYLFTEDPRSF